MIDEKNLYKTITVNVDGPAVTQHKIAIGKDDKIIVFSSTQKFRPKNRKQKKAMKKTASSVKKIDKNTYLVTEGCVMNMELLAKMLKCVVSLENIEGAELGEKGYLSGDSCAWVKDIVPINLVPAILEKNGWNKSTGWSYVGSEKRGYQFSKELDDKWGELDRMTYGDLQICQCENLRDWSYINECNHYFHFEFTYVHELQHLLFGLGLSMDLKV